MWEALNNPLIQLLLTAAGVGALAWLSNRRAERLRSAGQEVPSLWARMRTGLGFRDAADDDKPAEVPGKIVLQLTPEQLAELRAAYHEYLARQPAGRQAMSAEDRRATSTRPSSLLTLANWLAIVNDKPDDAPHTLIVGTTGTGKTTLAQAIAAARTGKVVILDPKWKPGKWGGAPAVPIDGDGTYAQIETAIQSLLAELNRRLVAMKRGTSDFEPLTIIAEELPTLVDECPSAPTLFKQMGRLGRELRIRLIGLSQSERVRSLGIEGEGDAKDNYAIIRLGKAAITVLPETRQLARPAALAWHGDHYPLDLDGVIELTRRPIPQARWWQPSALRTEHPDGAGNDSRNVAETRFAPGNEGVSASGRDVIEGASVTKTTVTVEEAALIARKLAQGVTPSDVAKSLPGYSPKRYSEFKAKVVVVQEALETVDESVEK